MNGLFQCNKTKLIDLQNRTSDLLDNFHSPIKRNYHHNELRSTFSVSVYMCSINTKGNIKKVIFLLHKYFLGDNRLHSLRTSIRSILGTKFYPNDIDTCFSINNQ